MRPSARPDTTPARLSITTNSGISKAIPKISSIRLMNEKNCVNSTRLVTSAGVNPMRTVMAFGSM